MDESADDLTDEQKQRLADISLATGVGGMGLLAAFKSYPPSIRVPALAYIISDFVVSHAAPGKEMVGLNRIFKIAREDIRRQIQQGKKEETNDDSPS